MRQGIPPEARRCRSPSSSGERSRAVGAAARIVVGRSVQARRRSLVRAGWRARAVDGRRARRRRRCRRLALGAVFLACVIVAALPWDAWAEQASEPASAAAGGLDAGGLHTCAGLVDGNVRCGGFNGDGKLGYGNRTTIGEDEPPASAGPVNVGPGRTAKAVATGDYHTCALLDDGSVRCWGFGANGRLGYANTNNVADKPTTTPDKAGPVDLGAGRTATAITVGAAHACAILDDGTVRCWGFGGSAQLGYANIKNVGDDETPGSVGPVFLGVGRTARAISAGA